MKFKVLEDGHTTGIKLSDFFSIHMKKIDGVAYFSMDINFSNSDLTNLKMLKQTIPITAVHSDDAERMCVVIETLVDMAVLSYIDRMSMDEFDKMVTQIAKRFEEFACKIASENAIN